MFGGDIKNLAPSCLQFWFLGMYPKMKVATPFASYSPWFSKRVVTINLWTCKPRGKKTMLSILVNQSHYQPRLFERIGIIQRRKLLPKTKWRAA
jgi:hypothetical protein